MACKKCLIKVKKSELTARNFRENLAGKFVLRCVLIQFRKKLSNWFFFFKRDNSVLQKSYFSLFPDHINDLASFTTKRR